MKTIDLHDFNLALIMSTPKFSYWYTIVYISWVVSFSFYHMHHLNEVHPLQLTNNVEKFEA